MLSNTQIFFSREDREIHQNTEEPLNLPLSSAYVGSELSWQMSVQKNKQNHSSVSHMGNVSKTNKQAKLSSTKSFNNPHS